MKSLRFARLFFILILAFSLVSFARAGDQPRFSIGGGVIHGGTTDLVKAGGDTINLMSARVDPTNEPGEPAYFGDFEDQLGIPAWNAWTHQDLTSPHWTHWNVSNYNQPDPGNHAAWCGDLGFPSCGAGDPAGGYGDNWHDIIEFRQAVPYTGLGSTVTVTATLIYDSEIGYDYTYLSYRYQGHDFGNLQSWTGTGTAAVVNSVSYKSEEYLGGTDVAVYFRFVSDLGFSDADCQWPTSGACQVDDINVNIVNGAFNEDYFEDFEHGGVPDDFGIWNVDYPYGVGDFSKIWTGLEDLDPCATNYSPQAAFIDDGIVVPGTGGSHCINWCYGPGGYIVNTTGGLAGSNNQLQIALESPVMAWPAPKSGSGPDDDGISLAFDAYRHEDFGADSPGIFYYWEVRSADTDGSAGNGVQDIGGQPWQGRNILEMGGPEYYRHDDVITDLMNPGRDEVQVRLTVSELGWIWYLNGNDGYPAPYFDNVTVKVFPHAGPGMSAREIDLAQDNFPASRIIDYQDLGSHHVRFDMARNISPAGHMRNDPGDSIVVDIASVRSGADLDGDPELHYKLDPNPIFDPYRSSGLPAQGSVAGMPAVGGSGVPTDGKWAFDLPDTGFLFPGDELHYFIAATDAIGGVGGTDPRTALMPPDTTGFSTGFRDPRGYDQSFTVRALPSIRDDGLGVYEHPIALFINDFGNRDPENAWYTAMYRSIVGTYLDMEEVYDIYYVNGPSSGVGNGIGGRADHLTLEHYTDILYTSGDLGSFTLANGDFNRDPGDDLGVLMSWLDLGEKDIFLTGDDLASNLSQQGAPGLAFLTNYMGVAFVSYSVRPLIGNQAAPLVQVMAGNPVFYHDLQAWMAYGGCPAINNFDAVETFGSGQRLAEFLDPGGSSGMYPYSAATLNIMNPGPTQSRAISMPVDLMFIHTDPGTPPIQVFPDRDQLFAECMLYFEVVPGPIGEVNPGVPEVVFGASHYPNPFNPRATIKYSMPSAGNLKLSIFNVRGQLVKTLIDGPRPAGADQTIVWDGSDNLGSSVSSGVYFYEVRLESDVKIGKMTLLK